MAAKQPSNGHESHFLTAKEVAHYLRIDVCTLYRMLGRKGSPPYRRIGFANIRFPRDKFLKWAEKTEEGKEA